MRPLIGWALAALLAVLAVAVSMSTKAPGKHFLKAQGLTGRIGKKPSCWEVGRHELECFHADPLLFEAYPFTPEMLMRSANRYSTTDLSMHRAFQRARDRGVLKVVVLGGSVTFGHQCKTPEGRRDNECAWPYRLQQWFDERIHDFEVEVRPNCSREPRVRRHTQFAYDEYVEYGYIYILIFPCACTFTLDTGKRVQQYSSIDSTRDALNK